MLDRLKSNLVNTLCINGSNFSDSLNQSDFFESALNQSEASTLAWIGFQNLIALLIPD